jgi:hypothetical protein
MLWAVHNDLRDAERCAEAPAAYRLYLDVSQIDVRAAAGLRIRR